MNARHQMLIDHDDGRDVTFACPEAGCGRRVVIRRSGGLVVLNRGDFSALHSGGTVGVQISTTIEP